MSISDNIRIAKEADGIIRERYSDAYEVLYDSDTDFYIVASPRNYDEGGDPKQPTAVSIGNGDDFEDAEKLYEAALNYTDDVDRLADTAEEW